MRGAHASEQGFPALDGIIPAYAGSTLIGRGCYCYYGDHPRVCGEHPLSLQFRLLSRGSSPRMRGALLLSTGRVKNHRIIPAYAGSTNYTSQGSGKPRIIPAYAGSTQLLKILSTLLRDHPRVCGEHSNIQIHGYEDRGSSPRMRGALDGVADRTLDRGIIPAYAGSTERGRRLREHFGDHPRVCGEHLIRLPAAPMTPGSSPRMRGALFSQLGCATCQGIIPAYAGSTTPFHLKHLPKRDHPRVCGEHHLSAPYSFSGKGSSPRMRGAQTPTPSPTRSTRIIPAYAGSTELQT